MAFTTVSIFCPLTALATNSTEPTGGVMRPIPRFIIMMIPKCTGSMPSSTTTGSRIGVRIRISGAMSIRQPNSSSIMLIINRMTYLLSDNDSSAAEISCGRPTSVITEPNAAAKAISTITMVTVLMVR